MILPYFNIKNHPIYDFYDNIEDGGFFMINNHWGGNFTGMAND